MRVRAIAGVTAVLAAVAIVPALSTGAEAAGPQSCSVDFRIEQDMASGGRWAMCWEIRQLEGVVLHEVTYTPPGGEAVEVLGSINLAQIHVPYDQGQPRFHDESDFGLGFNTQNLAAEDCPEGDLLNDGIQNVLCQQVQPAGYSYKDYDEQAQGSTLSLFSVSAIGAYNYVVAWNFDDDGTIRPEVGATGQLQMYGGNRSTGWNTGNGFGFAVAHMHNFYWRIDIDIDGNANDRVQELNANLSATRGSFTNSNSPFFTETARRVSPRAQRTWRVKDTQTRNEDGHPISYELLPNSDFIFRGPSSEAFTHNELYVTRLNNCERFASHNPTLGGQCGGNVSQFANGGSLRGADVVLWYGTSFHHLPRDEDEPHMNGHWSGFSLVPRDLTATNPIP